MSETDLVSTEAAPAPRKRGGLTGMVLAELRQLAGELNISGTTGMRKGDLIAAIKEKQAAPSAAAPAAQLPLPDSGPAAEPAAAAQSAASDAPAAPAESAPAAKAPRRRRAATRPAGAPDPQPVTAAAEATVAEPATSGPVTNGAAPAESVAAAVAPAPEKGAPEKSLEQAAPAEPSAANGEQAERPEGGSRRARQRRNRGEQNGDSVAAEVAAEASPAVSEPVTSDNGGESAPRENRRNRSDDNRDSGNRRGESNGRGGAERADNRADNRGGDNRVDNRVDNRAGNDNRGGDNRGGDNRGGPDNRGDNRADSRGDNRGTNDNRGPRDNRPDDDDEDGDGRGRRGRRFRDRRRGRDRNERTGGQTGGGGQGNVDTEVRDGDVLLPVAGIVDILDNYAFVRTTGYLSGPTDVYVSLSMVRKYGLRRGDAITGAVREPRDGEQSRQKFNPLVRVDSINGQDPESAKDRPEFTKLTPLYPNERLRLETEPSKLTTRVIDLVMPVGKGQRALIVSPPKAGKTTIMQNIANAITTNNPECHLMVVLVDERPEEVTDMQRSVKGEVIASTFDRPPTDHTTVAELSIERAKRLVEMGHDVVVLLDNITRLGRAYNLAAPASGRILSGGVDSTALYPPKRFLGAARNIEDGGSLTIFATALVETGSTMDTVIFEEFKGTGNAELKLDRKIADKRIFPAIDVGDSSTRKDELLMSPDEYAVMVKLRRVLSALDDQQAIDLLLTQLRKTRTNIEFLMQVAKNTPSADND